MSKKEIISQNFFNPSTRFLHSQLIDFHNILLNKISTYIHIYKHIYLFIFFIFSLFLYHKECWWKSSSFHSVFHSLDIFFYIFCQLNIDRKFVCSLKSFLYLYYLVFFLLSVVWYPQNLAFYILKYKSMKKLCKWHQQHPIRLRW